MWQSFLSSLLFLLLFSQPISSQVKVNEVLESLPAPDQVSSLSVVPIKSGLSCNFFQNIRSSFIGISDAGVDSTTAFNQAFIRALSMISLQNAYARGMSDFFNDTNEDQITSNYEEFCEIKATNNLPVSGLKIYDSFWLKSGEFVVFLNIDSSEVNLTERMNNSTSVAIYYKENELDGSHKIINKIKIENNISYPDKSKNHSESMTYILGNKHWLSNETYFDNRKIDTQRYKMFYITDKDCFNTFTDSVNEGTSSLDGLWYAIMNSMYRQLSSQLKTHFIKIKKVGDQYQNKQITLNRESGYFKFGCKLSDVVLIDNKLSTSIITEFPSSGQ